MPLIESQPDFLRTKDFDINIQYSLIIYNYYFLFDASKIHCLQNNLDPVIVHQCQLLSLVLDEICNKFNGVRALIHEHQSVKIRQSNLLGDKRFLQYLLQLQYCQKFVLILIKIY
ncbi:hypothetical protein pb186bvf_003090 [Paramecium bursaria]